jgi:hypothetical protein
MERKSSFSSSVFELGMERIFGMKIGGSDYYFVLKVSEISENQIFLYNESANENESIVSEKDEFRELLKLGGGSRIEGFSNLSGTKSTNVILIHDFLGIIKEKDYKDDKSLKEVIFSTSNHLKAIHGFCGCTSLCRIEIPSSVEKIAVFAFHGCTSLREVAFSSDSHWKKFAGFHNCTSLYQIEIPSSVEKHEIFDFKAFLSLRVVFIHAGCRVKINQQFRLITPFLVCSDEDVRNSRRLVHLGVRICRNA